MCPSVPQLIYANACVIYCENDASKICMGMVHSGEWTLWPSQFSSQTDIEHCKMVVVFKVTDTWFDHKVNDVPEI